MTAEVPMKINLRFWVFLEFKCRFCYINGPHKQYIQVDELHFPFWASGTCLYVSPQTTLFRRQKRCILRTFLKTYSWTSNMSNVVKYDVYLDTLLTMPIYVTTYPFS